VPEYFESNSVLITANIKSLICRDICIPFNTTVSQKINLTSTFSAEEEISKLFAQTRKNLPEAKNDFEVSIIPEEDNISVVVQNLNSDLTKINSLYFLPFDNGIFKNTADQKFITKENQIELRVEYEQFKTGDIRELNGIFIFEYRDAIHSQKVYEIKKQINTNN
jgi:DsbC/DsbD-like thiol-disulfide interchange protein